MNTKLKIDGYKYKWVFYFNDMYMANLTQIINNELVFARYEIFFVLLDSLLKKKSNLVNF